MLALGSFNFGFSALALPLSCFCFPVLQRRSCAKRALLRVVVWCNLQLGSENLWKEAIPFTQSVQPSGIKHNNITHKAIGFKASAVVRSSCKHVIFRLGAPCTPWQDSMKEIAPWNLGKTHTQIHLKSNSCPTGVDFLLHCNAQAKLAGMLCDQFFLPGQLSEFCDNLGIHHSSKSHTRPCSNFGRWELNHHHPTPAGRDNLTSRARLNQTTLPGWDEISTVKQLLYVYLFYNLEVQNWECALPSGFALP